MERLSLPARPDWQAFAERLGFGFHTMYGAPYWDETVAWRFSLTEIERDLEDPTAALHQMALAAVDRVIGDETLLRRLAIPERFWDWIAASWARRDPSLYGRFDLAYDGSGPAKMLEYNADTPTSLYETAFFQWVWLEQAMEQGLLPPGVDQFNAVQDRLIARMADILPGDAFSHFASVSGSDEDRGTVLYLEDCARQAGRHPVYVAMQDIGVDAAGRFADADSVLIQQLFKLYPWEMMLRDPFAEHLLTSPTRFLEPPWKAILSNKGLLPVLWQMFPGHPNLLPAWFAEDGPPDGADLSAGWVRKPLFSREGANVTLLTAAGTVREEADGPYGAEGWIGQAYAPLPCIAGQHMVVGSWVIGDTACGIGLREDSSAITRDLSRFVPHFIQ